MASRRRRSRLGFAPRLIVMAKSPQAGRVKTRLARDIGSTKATRFYRTCLRHTLLRLGRDRRWRTLLAVTPDRPPCPVASPGAAPMSQGSGDLGRRMQSLFRRVAPGLAIIVGGDIPAIDAAAIARAFRLLASADAIFGPTEDGGYWLVGLRRRPRPLSPFNGVRWSGPEALADTLANLKGSKLAFAARLRDVDRAEDLEAVGDAWQRLIPRRRR